MQIVASAENVTKSEKNYLGFRFLLSYLDIEMRGLRVWPSGGRTVRSAFRESRDTGTATINPTGGLT